MKLYLKAILTTLVITASLCVTAQVDTLQSLLRSATTDEQKIDAYLGLTRQYMLGGGTEEAYQYADSALQLSLKIKSKKLEADTRCFIGMLGRNTGAEYCPLLEEAVATAQQSGNQDAITFSTYPWVEFCVYDGEEGIRILTELLDNADKSVSQKNLGNTYKALGGLYETAGYFDAAEVNYLKAIEIFNSIDNNPQIDPLLGKPSAQILDKGTSNLLQTTFYTGQLYTKMGKTQEAIEYGERGYNMAKAMSISDWAWGAYLLGAIYEETGDLTTAAKLYNTSVRGYERIDEPGFHANALAYLGTLYQKVGEYTEAEKRLKESYNILKSAPNEAAEALVRLGLLYEITDRPDRSIEVYLKADSIFAAIDNNLRRINCQVAIADIQSKSGLYEGALATIEAQVPLAVKSKDVSILHRLYNTKADILERKGDINQAIEAANESLSVASRNGGNLSLIESSHKRLSQLYEHRADYKSGMYHLRESLRYGDSIAQESVTRQLKEEQVRQNVKEYIEEKEIVQQEADKLSAQNRIYLLLSIALLSLLAIGSFLFYKLRSTQKLLTHKNQELQKLNQTRDRFFGIIAHDLRSPMLALESVDEQMTFYADRNDTDKLKSISSMVSATSRNLKELLDNLLNWALSQSGTIPYHPQPVEIKPVVDNIISLLSGSAAQKEVEISNLLDKRLIVHVDENALSTVIRNIISNAVKYCKKKDRITIEGALHKDIVNITIADTGQGMTEEQLASIFRLNKKSKQGTSGEKGTGLGLILVRDLVEQNKGVLKIRSKKGEGTTVSIQLPKDRPT